MLKKTITYTDFDDVERTENFYFNLTEAELVELNYSVDGGLEERLKRIIESGNHVEILKEFKKIILLAYGVKSEDGKRFVKSDEIRNQFEATMAYSNLFMELATDDKKAAEFVNAIIPKVKNSNANNNNSAT